MYSMEGNSRKILIAEDVYGREFLKRIIHRMKKMKLIPQDLKVDVDFGARPCRIKMGRIIKSYLTAPYRLRQGKTIR